MMLSAAGLAAVAILPATRGIFPISAIAVAAHIADTLFHEMGHTVFFWLFGQPAIPMIFTMYGADQAGGMSMPLLGRSWFTQIVAFGALAYGCWRVRRDWPSLFIPAVLFSLIIGVLAFTRYYEVVILFMGHGGAIAMGGFFLFRAWLGRDARNAYERWLNAFFGFFLVLNNFYFSYDIGFNLEAQSDYNERVAFGISHNDFYAITEIIYSWTVKGIAAFTMAYCIAVIVGSFLLAACWAQSEAYE
jgi:hypothetical protein